MFRQQIFERDNHQCVYCGSKSDLTLDHVRAKSQGGEYTANNLVASCMTCNRSKATHHWLSWWTAQDHFDLGNFSRVISHIAT
jgi:hypothetical protein